MSSISRALTSVPLRNIRKGLFLNSRALSWGIKKFHNKEPYGDVLLSKTLSQKASDQGYLRCTIFNNQGEITHHGQEFKRQDFMKKHGLVARDLRKISRHSSGTAVGNLYVDIVPSVITRSGGILLSLLNVRALIKDDMVVIFDGGRDSKSSQSHGLFLKNMHERLKAFTDSDLPYEFRALEAILMDVTSNLSTELKVHSTVINNILTSLETSIDRIRLRYLLIQSKKLAQFHQRAKLVRDLLDEILEEDAILNSLYLTSSKEGHRRQGTNHQEVEMLLESYYKTSDEIVQRVENLISQIKTSEEIINITLDSNRNELMLLGLKFTVGLLSMTFAMYISSIYGMNLENFIEERDDSFISVVGLTYLFLGLLLIFTLKQLRGVQKMTMTSIDRNDLRKGKYN